MQLAEDRKIKSKQSGGAGDERYKNYTQLFRKRPGRDIAKEEI
jgi:hypothetical protein